MAKKKEVKAGIFEAMLAASQNNRGAVQQIFDDLDEKKRYLFTDSMKDLAHMEQKVKFESKYVKHKNMDFGGNAQSWAEVMDEAKKLECFYAM